MIRYKLARIVGERYLSANQNELEPNGIICLEYRVGEITCAKGVGVACYKRKENALTPGNIKETKGYYNKGRPIALLKLKPTGKATHYRPTNYGEDGPYAGGINYRSVEVLEVEVLGVEDATKSI